MLFSDRQIPQWTDPSHRHPQTGPNCLLSGQFLTSCGYQDHYCNQQMDDHWSLDRRSSAHSSRHANGMGLCQSLSRAVWTMMSLFLIFLLLLSSHNRQSHGVLALSCAPCDPNICPDTKDCPGGVVTDVCFCCQVCAKMEDESCGGSWGLLGKCDRNLQCFIQPKFGQPITGWESGICKVIPEMICNHTNCPPAYRHRLCPPDSYLQTIRTNNYSFSGSGGGGGGDGITNESPDMSPPTAMNDHNLYESADTTSYCVCNMSSCRIPTCPVGFALFLKHNASGSPGDCCDDYICKTAQECDPIICPPIDETPCPEDSIQLPNIWTPDRCCEIQQGCACPAADLCDPVYCPPGYQIQIHQRATGKPGSCCDRFRCVNESGLTCSYDGQEKKNGERWKIGRCRTCRCQDGINRCKDKVCPDDSCTWMDTPPDECCPVCRGCVSDSGMLYNNSAVWKENECTTCSCVNGQAQCQAEMCAAHCSNPKRVPGQCCPVCPDKEQETVPPVCPSMDSCRLSCSQGLEVSPDGCPRCQCRKEKCSLACPFGFKSDVEGNQLCECQSRREMCPSLAEQGCEKKCEYGYKVSRGGCIKCKCNKCPPFKCTKRCLYGRMLNDEGCPLCKCKETTVPERPNFNRELEEIDGRSCMSRNGVRHDNGESWNDRCRACYCHNGMEMCSVISCPAPQCPNPVFRIGDCCPSCPGMMLSSPNGEKQLCQAHDGQLYVEGETWKMDSCTHCVCHGGNILCETPSCPPLVCHHPVKPEGQCCAICKGNDLSIPLKTSLRRRCKLSTGVVYRHDDIWRTTPCQSCICQDGQFHCYNQMCPILTCAKTVLKKDQCCPTCVDTARPEVCHYEGESYNSDETWRGEDNCSECLCSSGHIFCHPPSCPALECSVRIRRKGQCCPECYDHSKFHSNELTPSLSSKYNKTEVSNDQSSHRGFVIGLSVPLIFLFIVLIILLILLLYLQRRRRQFPFHKRTESTSSDEHQGSIPFLQSHTKISVAGDKPYLEKLCPELSSDRIKSDRPSNNYTEIVFGDPGKETVAKGRIMT